METVQNKKFSVEDIKKIQFVRNISGGMLYINDLSEDGKEGNGVTLLPNQTVELEGLVTEAARIRSKGLRRALEGIPAGMGFPQQNPTLMVVDSLDATGDVTTVIRGETISKEAPVKAAENHYDIARMRQDLKEMEDELESTQAATKRLELQASIEFTKKEIEKLEGRAQKGLEANVVKTDPNKRSDL